jgi:hypothetical protein
LGNGPAAKSLAENGDIQMALSSKELLTTTNQKEKENGSLTMEMLLKATTHRPREQSKLMMTLSLLGKPPQISQELLLLNESSRFTLLFLKFP